MLVSIIIVNYRVKFFLEQTIASSLEAIEGIKGEIIVIDNNSGDDSMEFIRHRFRDSITIIENKENVGFARANNQGIKIAQGEFILILNPDTIICRKNITDCLEWMRSHADCGGIGVRMIDGNGKFLPESKRSFTTPWVSFCKIFGLSSLFPMSPRFARYHLRYLPEKEAHEIEILAGAFMFIRGNLLKKVGGFDETFFMYGEDIDLSYRLTLEGYKNYYLPTTIIHYKGESTKKDSIRYVKVFYEAMLIFFKKHFPNYSIPFAILIRMAIYARASAAVIRRIATRPFSKKKNDNRSCIWKIISSHPEDIRPLLSSTASITNDVKATDIVIDNRDHDYASIIAIIDKEADERLRFHIYSNENNMIISPKMAL